MTAIIGAAAGTYITARVYKFLATNPSLFWGNTYEFLVNAVPDSGDLNDLADALTQFERSIHYTDTRFDRVVLSTWVPDGEPYDPASFISYPQGSVAGTQSDASDTLSLNHVLFVRRNTTFGQNGKVYYRRCLCEADVTAQAGLMSLQNAGGIQTILDAGLVSSGLDAYIGTFAGVFTLAMKSALPVVREVTALTVVGARVVQYNNRYFDVP